MERFHRYLKKCLKIAVADSKNVKHELSKILMAYRSTPQRSSGMSPSSLFMKRELKTKLPMFEKPEDVSKPQQSHYQIYVDKMKKYADDVNQAEYHDFKIGDVVYVANMVRESKLQSKYGMIKHVIIREIAEHTYEVVNTESGKVFTRNVKFLRKAPLLSVDDEDWFLNFSQSELLNQGQSESVPGQSILNQGQCQGQNVVNTSQGVEKTSGNVQTSKSVIHQSNPRPEISEGRNIQKPATPIIITKSGRVVKQNSKYDDYIK